MPCLINLLYAVENTYGTSLKRPKLTSQARQQVVEADMGIFLV
jgi:hypothetical protein